MQPLPEDEAKQDNVPHDCFRQVYLGQLSDPIFPHHPEPPESPEDELTRIALADPAAQSRDEVSSEPTFWRAVAVLLFAVLALAVVFVLK